MTTGDKATDTLISVLPENTEKPLIGTSTSTYFADRDINLYRLPSSSRAYPLALEKKQKPTRNFLRNRFLVIRKLHHPLNWQIRDNFNHCSLKTAGSGLYHIQ